MATLVNVHIVGGSADLVDQLEGATMRTAVVLDLIDALRKSGYPGYEEMDTTGQNNGQPRQTNEAEQERLVYRQSNDDMVKYEDLLDKIGDEQPSPEAARYRIGNGNHTNESSPGLPRGPAVRKE